MSLIIELDSILKLINITFFNYYLYPIFKEKLNFVPMYFEIDKIYLYSRFV